MSTVWPSTSESAADPEPEPPQPKRGHSFFLGKTGYLHAARLQHALLNERMAGLRPDTFLFLEHPPLITLGRGADEEHLLASSSVLGEAGAEVWETTRGGDITYHGPGQLVGYGILDLKEHGRDLGLYLRNLEEVLIRVLARYGFAGTRRQGMTGTWVEDKKVAAIGVRAERWTTSHGFAFNVSPNLSHFDWIVPCGIRDYGVTSLAELVREKNPSAPVPTVKEVAGHTLDALREVFGISFEPGDATDLDDLELPSEPPLGGIVRKFPKPQE